MDTQILSTTDSLLYWAMGIVLLLTAWICLGNLGKFFKKKMENGYYTRSITEVRPEKTFFD